MKVISILNIKGGVGKTISTVNIAAVLGKEGSKVLVIDLDPQANATKYLNLYKNNIPTTYELLKGENLNYINETEYKGVSIVPSNIKLILSESEILADTKKARETRLRKWIKGCKEEFDYIIIDCSPSLGTLTTNALATSDFVLVPIKIDKFALDGFEYLLASIEETKEEFNEDLKLLGVFVTMDKRTKINNEIKAELKKVLKNRFFNQSIRDNVDVIKSTFNDTPLVYFNKSANAAKDYKALVEEIKQCLI